MSSLNVHNEKIAGLRVRARIASCCHVLDSEDPEGFRHIEIPAGSLGTLTGDIFIWLEGIDPEECRAFAEDVARVRDALQKDIMPLFSAMENWWATAERLSGDDRIAAHVALTVRWDGIAEQEPGTLNCADYIPWLELVEEHIESEPNQENQTKEVL